MEYREVNKFINQKLNIVENTRISYESDIRLCLDEINKIKKVNDEKKILEILEGLDPNNTSLIQDVFINLKKSRTKGSYNKRVVSMSLFCNYLVKSSIIKKSPMESIPKFKIQTEKVKNSIDDENEDFINSINEDSEDVKKMKGKIILTKEEINNLIKSIELNKNHLYSKSIELCAKRDKFLVGLCATTGLRISEATNIKMSHIKKVDNGYMINIFEHKTASKIGAKRVPISNKCVKLYEDYLIERNKTKNVDNEIYLFLSYRGGQFIDKSAQYSYDKILERLNIGNTTLHCLRHSFRNIAIRNDTSYEMILLIGGWTRKGVGKTYVNDSIDFDQAKIEASSLIL